MVMRARFGVCDQHALDARDVLKLLAPRRTMHRRKAPLACRCQLEAVEPQLASLARDELLMLRTLEGCAVAYVTDGLIARHPRSALKAKDTTLSRTKHGWAHFRTGRLESDDRIIDVERPDAPYGRRASSHGASGLPSAHRARSTPGTSCKAVCARATSPPFGTGESITCRPDEFGSESMVRARTLRVGTASTS
jgi:hypothetical protein